MIISLELATIIYTAVLLGGAAGLTTVPNPAPGTLELPDLGPNHLVGKLPALGWNAWNAYYHNVQQSQIYDATNHVISLGLKEAGYIYINVDDCWSNKNGRDALTGRLKPNDERFPGGIKSLADYVHSRGLLFGIYSDAGDKTCADYPGSLGYEMVDAQTWAEWGVDYLKYDNCAVPDNWKDDTNVPSDFDWYNSNAAIRYRRMGDALNAVASIRPIQYSLCIWGESNVLTWGARVGHSWRVGYDSDPNWGYLQKVIIDTLPHLKHVDFWAHADMDMMEIGNAGLTFNEQRTHFAMWVALKSPILLGTDLSKLAPAVLEIIKNTELLAFSQDTTVGAPAKPYKTQDTYPPEFYTGKSSKGTHVFIMNTGDSASKVITFSEVPGLACTSCKVHDMWTGKDLGNFNGSFTVAVDRHDTAAFLLT